MAVTEKPVATPEIPVSPALGSQGQKDAVTTEAASEAQVNWDDMLTKAPKDVLLKVLDQLPDQDFINHKRVQSEADRRSSKVIQDNKDALNRTLATRLQMEREEATVEALNKLDPDDLPPKAKEWMEQRAKQNSDQQAIVAALTQVWSTVVGPRSPIRNYINELPSQDQSDLQKMATIDRVEPGIWLEELIKRHGKHVESRVRSTEEKDRDARVSARIEAEMAKRREELPTPDLGASVREGTTMNDNDWLTAWGDGTLPATKENFLKADELLGTNFGKKIKR